VKIILAEHAGYCYGVERALGLVEKAIAVEQRPICILGPLIHNPQVVKELKDKGVQEVSSPGEAIGGSLVIRTHGVGPDILKQAENLKLKIIDATCPFVAKAQRRARQLVREGYRLIIIGEKHHPEVEGILAHAQGQAQVVQSLSELRNLKSSSRTGVVVQTTQQLETFQQIVGALASISQELKVFNTICHATNLRQSAARQVAKKSDVMVVVGGKNSANTSRLVQICQSENVSTYHIETARELNSDWLKGVDKVGVTAGASTPEFILAEVVEAIEKI
jgi:4-hydroxy-3-methylbut-2-enyl diphosphate reductase